MGRRTPAATDTTDTAKTAGRLRRRYTRAQPPLSPRCSTSRRTTRPPPQIASIDRSIRLRTGPGPVRGRSREKIQTAPKNAPLSTQPQYHHHDTLHRSQASGPGGSVRRKSKRRNRHQQAHKMAAVLLAALLLLLVAAPPALALPDRDCPDYLRRSGNANDLASLSFEVSQPAKPLSLVCGNYTPLQEVNGKYDTRMRIYRQERTGDTVVVFRFTVQPTGEVIHTNRYAPEASIACGYIRVVVIGLTPPPPPPPRYTPTAPWPTARSSRPTPSQLGATASAPGGYVGIEPTCRPCSKYNHPLKPNRCMTASRSASSRSCRASRTGAGTWTGSARGSGACW